MTMREQGDREGNLHQMAVGQRYSVKGYSNIGALSIGSCWINTIEFIYPWNTETRVTTVPAGERFDFVVNYQAQNLVGGITDQWGMCIVWWDSIDGPGLPTPISCKLNGYYFGASSSTVKNQNYARIANNYTLIMPARNVVLKFNMFANDDHNPAQLYPDPSAWQLLR